MNTFAELVEWLHRAPVATLLEQDNSIQVPDIGEPGFEFTWAPVVSSNLFDLYYISYNALN